MPAFVSLLKCTGVFSLGILSGVHINFATATIQCILDLSSAPQAKRAFTISLGLLRQVVRPLEITASASLLTAFLFSGRGRRHPYLLMSGLAPVLAVALERAKMTGVEIGVECTQTERRRRSGESVEINGEVIMGGLQRWRGWGLVRSGILSFGFALGVVGIWGEP